MKKKKSLLTLAFALALCMALTSCGCSHQWTEATCTQARVCTKCGETEGEPLGHTWQEATCTEARTCTKCGETEGEPLGHTWQEATCTAPETCALCGETRGDPGEHKLDAAGRCDLCGGVIGTPLTPENFEDHFDINFKWDWDGKVASGTSSNEGKVDSRTGVPDDGFGSGVYTPYLFVWMEGDVKPGRECYDVSIEMTGKKIIGSSQCPDTLTVTTYSKREGNETYWWDSRNKEFTKGRISTSLRHDLTGLKKQYDSSEDAAKAAGPVKYEWTLTDISGYVIED